MKTHYISLFLLLLIISCKSRKVSLSKTDSNAITSLTKTTTQNSLKTDSTKTHTEYKTERQEQHAAELTITPDSGTIQRVYLKPGEAFTYVGKAKNISYKQATNSVTKNQQTIQQNKAETTDTHLTESLTQKTQTHVQTKTKAVAAKGTGFSFWIVAVIVALVAVAAYYGYKFWAV